MEKFPGMYNVSSDKLKWQIAGYHRDKHRGLARELALELFEAVCKKSLPIVLEVLFEDEAAYLSSKKTAEKYGYKFISIKLTAPDEVLLQRFRERVESAKAANSKISITDENMFIQNLSRKYFIPTDSMEFDTSKMDAETITEKIVNLV